MLEDEFLTFSEAAGYLGVSRVTLWRRVRDGSLPTHQTSSSKREKLVKRKDLDALRRPRKMNTLRYRTRRARKRAT